jgi:hypothetical protein
VKDDYILNIFKDLRLKLTFDIRELTWNSRSTHVLPAFMVARVLSGTWDARKKEEKA